MIELMKRNVGWMIFILLNFGRINFYDLADYETKFHTVGSVCYLAVSLALLLVLDKWKPKIKTGFKRFLNLLAGLFLLSFIPSLVTGILLGSIMDMKPPVYTAVKNLELKASGLTIHTSLSLFCADFGRAPAKVELIQYMKNSNSSYKNESAEDFELIDIEMTSSLSCTAKIKVISKTTGLSVVYDGTKGP